MTVIIEVTVFSLVLSLVLVLATRFLTNQNEVRKVKEDINGYKELMKRAQKAGNKEEAKKYTEMMFKTSRQQMKFSMKSMMVSMIIVMFAFGWLNNSYSNVVVDLDKSSGSATGFFISGVDKNKVEVSSDSKTFSIDSNNDGTFSDDEGHNVGDVIKLKGSYWKAAKTDNTLQFTMYVAKAPFNIPFLGTYLQWFWIYILLTIPSTLIFRKLLNVV